MMEDAAELPEEFERSAASLCCPASKGPAPSATYDAVHARRWCDRPGFIDPFEVVYTCVRRLKAATYPNVKYSRGVMASARSVSPDKSQLCPGLALYFCRLEPDPQIDADVKEYIATSNNSILKRISRQPYLAQVLLFLLKYLYERGPFVKFRYTSLEHLNQMRKTQRWLSRAFLNTMCEHELEFESAVLLGDYLNYAVTVAYTHDLFWMKELLADLFGPLVVDFVNIGHSREDLPEQVRVSRRSDVMLRLIEGTPWDSLKRQQNFNLVLSTDPEGDCYRRRSHVDFEAARRLTLRPVGHSIMVTNSMQIVDFFKTVGVGVGGGAAATQGGDQKLAASD